MINRRYSQVSAGGGYAFNSGVAAILKSCVRFFNWQSNAVPPIGRTAWVCVALFAHFALPGTTGAVPRYEVFELVLGSERPYRNPFQDVTVAARFKGPTGRVVQASGFHDGGGVWRIRFAPDDVGNWTYTTIASETSDGGLHGKTGSFECEQSQVKGFIRVSRTNPRTFAYDDGTPFFFLGDTAYALFVQDPAAVQRYMARRREQGFTVARVWLNSARVLSPDKVSYVPAEFQRYDRHMEALKAAGMNVEIILFHNPDFVRGLSVQQMKAYASYIVARWAAHRNVALWCISNEVEVYPDGRYDSFRPDPGAYQWAADMAKHIRSLDPHRHPITVHHANMAYEGDIWRDYLRGATDVIQQQKHGDVDQAPLPPHSRAGRFDGVRTDGDAFDIERWIEHDLQFGVPVINGEYGYEFYAGADGRRCAPLSLRFSTNWQRKGAWRVVASGGHISAGYERTLKCPEIFEPEAGYEGAAQLGHLAKFMTALPFAEMEPQRKIVNAPNLCLARPGTVYVGYYIGRNMGGVDSDGTLMLDLTALRREFEAVWFDPRRGTFLMPVRISGGGRRTFSAPDIDDDWVLLVKRVGPEVK